MSFLGKPRRRPRTAAAPPAKRAERTGPPREPGGRSVTNGAGNGKQQRSSTRPRATGSRNGVEIKDEVAVWDRSGLTASTERLKTTTRVTLEWPSEEKIVCDQDGMGDNPWADDVVHELT